MKYFDAHCHVQISQFDEDREEVLARMQETQTAGIVVGVDLATSKAAIELAESHDFLYAAIGLHPTDNLEQKWLDISSQMEELARHPKVVAIGECGLDYFHSGSTEGEREAQKQRFTLQVELALKVKKPLIIHCRDNPKRSEGEPSAHEDLQKILFSYSAEYQNRSVPVVIHFFTGSKELAQKYIDAGCYLSFPGPITYTDRYDESIQVAPMDKILSETDSPFAAPVPFRGKRNEPVYVSHVVAKLALIKETDLDTMASQIILNSQKVFGIAHG